MGITVSHTAMLAHCHALTQACAYTEGERDALHFPVEKSFPFLWLREKHPVSLRASKRNRGERGREREAIKRPLTVIKM